MTLPKFNFSCSLDEDELLTHESLVSSCYSRWAPVLSRAEWYRDERIWDRLDRIVALRPNRLLELCCGVGVLLDRLAHKMPNASFDAVDISSTAVAEASKRCSNLENVRILVGDWTTPIPRNQKYDVIVIKNSLHLIANPLNKLRDLHRISHSGTRLIIVETVSPSLRSLEFVQGLFRITDTDHIKANYFTRRNLLSLLTRSGWLARRTDKIDQLMSVGHWLNIKVGASSTRREAEHFIASASNDVKEEMNITSSPNDISMLRRQLIVFAYPSASPLTQLD